ncbi:SAM-dependent methyltransferase [Sulfitobacter sp. SK012]|uniref:methyltransferase domain-containing protein n=1 Tax=Sulfitobacter sp. SK012 TaxID=1389005 RepID=UPI000E0C20EE|nr:methyltransferase domain-containing protein [Sulfitobacter sp. SK012]AXI44651.1 SAM-dependent methyltransferase [Sulfitobacter sp. SK012]
MSNQLTDPRALALNRARAVPAAMFLHDAAAEEVQDRLGMVNRPFTSAGVVSGFPQIWGTVFPNALMVPDTDTLPLELAAHDLVLHMMALHWANDPVGQLIQCRRALRPDGLFLGACFGGQTLVELRQCLSEAEIAITGGLSPRVAPMAELRDLGGLLQRAGFALPVADSVTLKVEYRDIWHLMRDLRAMGETNALARRLRKPTRRAVIQHADMLYEKYFSTPEDRITATFDLHLLTGWAPSDNQPKPLRPGSAQKRLADALATNEQPLHD